MPSIHGLDEGRTLSLRSFGDLRQFLRSKSQKLKTPMKQQIAQVLNRNIVADNTLLSLLQSICFVLSIAALALSFWKLSRLDLTESQLFFGILLSSITPLLFIVIGLLLPFARTVKNA